MTAEVHADIHAGVHSDVHADVRLAARALARHALVHAYGHVSARLAPATFVVTPAHPLGQVTRSTALVDVALGEAHDEALPAGALPEVRLHQAIYRARADVGGICRFQAPAVMALSALRRTPRALHGLGAYFAPQPPLWDDPALIRDPERAGAVAAVLATHRAVVLRGNGAVTVGPSVRAAACHAFFLEDAARIELATLGHPAVPYTAEDAARRAGADAQLYARMWEFLLGDDLQEAR
ncbi:MAG TPA: class II aldolase/adducin family protein [Kofleriaceae bacterium]|jgi:HCOMODA/2-hydroxy-3-carboxy-muconic semialdehyde decarboxylase|nr:class II aldolase/adducin family protein [Kofleriaceae bacterium]